MICDSRLQRLTAEEDNAPPAVAAEQEAPLQPEDAQTEQCNGQGQANGLPNGKPAPARPLSFKRQGSSSSVNNQQPKNGRSSPIRNGRTSPPQSAKVHESMHTSNLRAYTPMLMMPLHVCSAYPDDAIPLLSHDGRVAYACLQREYAFAPQQPRVLCWCCTSYHIAVLRAVT